MTIYKYDRVRQIECVRLRYVVRSKIYRSSFTHAGDARPIERKSKCTCDGAF